MNIKALATLVYTLLVFIGGVLGFALSGSLSSLIMGSIFAFFLAISAWGLWKNFPTAGYVATALTFSLGAFFCYRFAMTGKLFPGAAMVLFSMALLILLFRRDY